MIAELILGAFLAFGMGTYVGQEHTKKELEKREPEKRQPDVWPPVSHKELLKTCGIMCGEGNFKSYNSVYGKCICQSKE